MSHNLTIRENGRVEMAYTGETPWHGLGTSVAGAMTSAEALDLAGLDWEVLQVPMFGMIEAELPAEEVYFPTFAGLVRGDTREPFGVMGQNYTVVQNRDSFQVFDEFVGAGEAIYHTAGSLNGGRKVWILARLPGDLQLNQKDVLIPFIMLLNTHDGSGALIVKLTLVRAVCANTVGAALKDKGAVVKIPHRVNIHTQAVRIRETLGLSEAHFALMMRGIERMADTKMDHEAAESFTRSVFDLPRLEDVATDQLHWQQRRAVDDVLSLYWSEPTNQLAGSKGTAWGMYNAVTYYTDHDAPLGTKTDTKELTTVEVQSKRLDNAWFGGGAALKERAWGLLVPTS